MRLEIVSLRGLGLGLAVGASGTAGQVGGGCESAEGGEVGFEEEYKRFKRFVS